MEKLMQNGLKPQKRHHIEHPGPTPYKSLLKQCTLQDYGHLPFLMNSLTHFDKLMGSLLEI